MGFSHTCGAPAEKNEALRSIQTAYDLGCTLFDPAEAYGTAANKPLIPDSRPGAIGTSVEGLLKTGHHSHV